ncbi:hypothetical protein GCM10010272_54370 [Streptomyces lateritius]|nr:hypothetical protein GCM10010272_54370 [Streptomyces lateritius]
MSAVEFSRAEAVALVQRIMEADGASEDEVDDWLDRLDRALSCPSGYVSGLVLASGAGVVGRGSGRPGFGVWADCLVTPVRVWTQRHTREQHRSPGPRHVTTSDDAS